MRYITIPPSVGLQVNGEPWTFTCCVRHVVNSHALFNQSGPGIRASIRVLDAFEKCNEPGKTVELQEEDWRLLQMAMEGSPLVPDLADDAGRKLICPGRTFITYLEAVSDEATRSKEAKL